MVAGVRNFTCEKCGDGGQCLSYRCPNCGWDLERVPRPATALGPEPVAVPTEINPPPPKPGRRGWRVLP